MVSSAPFAMWMVMRLAREKVTVTLDGQGGDELLGGYDHYPYVYLRELLTKRRYRTFVHEAWRSRDIVGPLIRRRLGQRRHPVDVAGLLTPELTEGRSRPVDDRVKDDLKLRLLQDFTTYSLPPLLRYEDRASMAHSLEARLPFLDQELVEYILALPADAIIEHGWNRRVLREGLKDVLPPVVYRPPQEGRLHHARVPLVPARASGAERPAPLAELHRPQVLGRSRGRRRVPPRVRR